MKRLAKWAIYYVSCHSGYALVTGKHGLALGIVGVMLIQFSGIFLWEVL